jgi:hypothetical protein
MLTVCSQQQTQARFEFQPFPNPQPTQPGNIERMCLVALANQLQFATSGRMG